MKRSPFGMRDDLPTGTVTLLFTDVEGSTRLLRELGADSYAEALAEHRRTVRAACTAQGGVEVDTQGDAFFFAFASALGAVAAAHAMTEALAPGPIHLRIGLHTGTPLVTGEGFVGDDVHFAARVAASGHGGQVVLSASTRELVDGSQLTDLGEHRLKDIDGPVSIFQLGSKSFPLLKTIRDHESLSSGLDLPGARGRAARSGRPLAGNPPAHDHGPGRAGEDALCESRRQAAA